MSAAPGGRVQETKRLTDKANQQPSNDERAPTSAVDARALATAGGGTPASPSAGERVLHASNDTGHRFGSLQAGYLLRLQRVQGNHQVARMIAASRSTAPSRPAPVAPGSHVAPHRLVPPVSEPSEEPEQPGQAPLPHSHEIGSAPPPPSEREHTPRESEAIERSPATGANAPPVVQRSIGDRILGRVAQFARNIPGYPLLTVVLGRDPITGNAVERNAVNLVHGMLSLVPGGNALFENLQQSGAIERAFSWFSQEIAKLNLTFDAIRALFRQAIDALSWTDILDPIGAVRRVVGTFTPMIARIRGFAVAAGRKVLEFIFEGVLNLAGPLGQQVLGIVRRAGNVFSSIIQNPVGFVSNLIQAIGQGFQQFSRNIMTHLRAGLIGWLFGTLARTGLQLPREFNLQGIISIVLQLLGLSYGRVRGMLVRVLGEPRVAALEGVFDFLRSLATQGISAAWQKILEFADTLVDTVLGAVRDWVAQSIVGAAITRLLTMFNPAGAIIQAIVAVYNTIRFFIERAQQIAALANAIFDSIASIAAGNLSAAINYVEQTMARTLPVIISFLARLLGLGDIGGQIRNIIQRVQSVVERALSRVVGWIAQRARGLLARLRGPQGPAPGPVGARDARSPRQQRAAEMAAAREAERLLEVEGATPETVRAQLPALKQRHRLGVVELVAEPDGEHHITALVQRAQTASRRLQGKVKIKLRRPAAFWKSTREALRTLFPEEHKKNVKSRALVKTGQARRHIISSQEMLEHYESKLNGLSFAEAKQKLEAKGETVEAPLSNKTIQAAAQRLLRAAFNEAENLWVGDSSENSSLQDQRDFPDAWNPQRRAAHVRMIKNQYYLD